MKLYFDKNIRTYEVDGKLIIFNPRNNYMIKVDEDFKAILDYLLKHKSGEEINLINFEGIEISELEYMLTKLVQNRIIYMDLETFENDSTLLNSQAYLDNFDPNRVYIHITQRCNLKCTYCYNKSNLNKPEELTMNQWIGIIDDLKDKGITDFIFTGGEPLIREDLYSIIKHTKDDNIEVTLLTNGTLLHKVDSTIYDFIDNVIISLDSINTNVNSKNRVNSQYYQIHDNIAAIDEKYRDKFTIRTVITKNNQYEIADIKKYVEEEYKMKHTSIIFIPNNKDEIDLMPDIVSTEIDKKEYRYYKNNIMQCGGAYKVIALDSNGDIYPCQNLIVDEFKIGNIMENDWFVSLAKSNITQQFMNLKVQDMEKCKDCEFIIPCGGGCRAIAYKVYGNLNSHLHFFCDYLKKNEITKIKSTRFVKEKSYAEQN